MERATLHELGRAGYEAYAAETGGKTFDGRDMPDWNALGERIQIAWAAAAHGIRTMLLTPPGGKPDDTA